jgi:hypothetical protein
VTGKVRIIRGSFFISSFEDGKTSMKDAVFWDVTPCGSIKNRHFEET